MFVGTSAISRDGSCLKRATTAIKNRHVVFEPGQLSTLERKPDLLGALLSRVSGHCRVTLHAPGPIVDTILHLSDLCRRCFDAGTGCEGFSRVGVAGRLAGVSKRR